MNTRVLELIKNPRIITESDLEILETETGKMPYAQSIRALYLYGINLYKPGNYKENLSKTAAYTTDKKILYQFINSEKLGKKDLAAISPITTKVETESPTAEKPVGDETKPAEPELVTEIERTDNHSVLNKFDVNKIIESEENLSEEFIVVKGEKNRLLYEGEENFLEEKTPEIDIEASKEAGQLTLKEDTETIESQIIIDENPSEETVASTEIINKEKPDNEPDTYEPSEPEPEITSKDISFSGIQDFLPDVKFSVPKNHVDYLNPPKKDFPMPVKPTVPDFKKTSKPEKKEFFVEKLPEKELTIEDDDAISFTNTQIFEINGNDVLEEPEVEIRHNKHPKLEHASDINKNRTETETQPEAFQTEAETEWKPMQVAPNIPDALIGQETNPKTENKTEKKQPVTKILKSELNISESIDNSETKEETSQQPTDLDSERPVFNVSFFGNDVAKIEQKKNTPTKEESLGKVDDQKESNVGAFINTWQSWLKIDRAKPEDVPVKTKEKIIDNFIENNPKISQLKEESNFVIKEKKDDISHLMTETLAKLYADQKLYTKAIKAYDTLAEKHPDKSAYFLEKIEQIKEIRKS